MDRGEAAEALRGASCVVPHTDADGLAAGAIALRARGERAGDALLLPRGETPFVRAPERAAVLDWGVRPFRHRPALVVDHHVPETALEGVVVVSGHGERPEISTSVLARRIVPDAPAWLAALGAFGDLGPAAFELPECEGARRGAIRKLAPLVNAPRRVPNGPVREALGLLVDAGSAAEALEDPRARLLGDARDEWRAAYRDSLRRPPAVADRVAHVRLTTPYQVHPLVATAWAARLAPRVVLVSNDGYLPGRVNFAVRGGNGDLRRFLREALPGASGELGNGHERATGGSLDPDEFRALLAGLGLT